MTVQHERVSTQGPQHRAPPTQRHDSNLQPVCRLHQDFGGRPAPLGERQPPKQARGVGGAQPSHPAASGWATLPPPATQRCVRQIFGKFGHLTDAAVFPARIGPLGYAFVNFEQVAHAMRGVRHAQQRCGPPCSRGNKQLKMRFKPAKVSMANLEQCMCPSDT